MNKITSISWRENIIKTLMCIVSVLNLSLFVFSSDTFYNLSFFSAAAQLLLISNVAILVLFLCTRFFERHVFETMGLLASVVIFGYFSYEVHPSGSIAEFFVLLAGYIAVPIYMLVIPELKYTTNLRNWFKQISIVYALFFIYCGFFTPTYREETDALMLGYSNSNRTGAYMLLVTILLIVMFAREKKKWLRICSWGMEIALLYLMILTQSRTAFLLGLACFIYSVQPRAPKVGKRYSVFCVLFPAVFYALYTYTYDMGWLSEATILGKTIYSGRQDTFVLDALEVSLLGNYGDALFGGLNYVQSVLNTLGIIGIVLCWGYYIRFLISDFFDDCDYDYNTKIARFCFSTMLLHGCTEAFLYTGGTVYAGMIGCILLVASMNKTRNEEVQNI